MKRFFTRFNVQALVLGVGLFLLPGLVSGQTNPTVQALPYSQNFSTFTGSTTTYPAGIQGWTIAGSLSTSYVTTAPNGDFTLAGGTNATTTAGVYDMNGKIGLVSTGSALRSVCLSINTTSLVTIVVSFDAATQGQTSSGRINQIGLQYRVGTSGTFTDVAASGYSNNATSTINTGTAASNTSAISVTLPSACEGQSVVQLRWVIRDVSGGGNRPSFSIDNINVSGTAAPTPTIAVSSTTQVAAANVLQGLSNQPISNFQVAVTSSAATLNAVAFNTGGSYITSDITGFKLYYNSTANTFGSAVQIGTTQASVASGGTVTFSGLSTSISNGATGYFWLTASVSASGTISNTFNAAASPTLTFASGSPTGSITEGGIQTITECTPVNVTSPGASVANISSTITWTNPSCLDEIMIIGSPAANTGGTLTGDGTAYTGNLAYGSGSSFGNGFVLYKGSTSSQIVTGLTNGVTYFYKFFTRKGLNWSAGTEVSATPSHPVISWTGGNTTWLTAANWSTGSAPSGASAEAFFDNNTNTGTIGINMNSISAGNSSIGAIHFGASATTARTFNNSSTVAAGTFTLNGLTINSIANTIIRNASSGTHTITNGSSQALNIGLGNSTDNIVAIDGTGGITINSNISGASRKLTKAGSGSGILTLTGANTYTGLTTISAGTLKLNRTGGTTIPATNNVTVSGGILQISTNQTLNDLTLNGGDVTVDDGVTLTINGVLTLTSGKITLGTGSIVIGSGGSISGASASSYIVTTNTSTDALGTLTMPVSAGVMKQFPIGSSLSFDPVELTPTAAGSFSAKVKNSFTNAVYEGVKTVAREWNIAIASGTPGATIISLTNGGTAYIPTKPRIGHYTGTAWQELTATHASNKWTLTAGTSSFSPFGVGDEGGFLEPVLAVDMKMIRAYSTEGGNRIDWTTASESNVSHFNIERSANERSIWTTIGSTKGIGTSRIEQQYSFLDEKPASINYYRLRSVDFDGKESLSSIVSVLSSKSGKVQVYPNPVTDKMIISTESNDMETFSIVNMLGQNVQTGQLNGQKEVSVNELSAGTYFLKVGAETIKFVKR